MAIKLHINRAKNSLSHWKHKTRRRAKKWLADRERKRPAQRETNLKSQSLEPEIPRVRTQRFYSSANRTPNAHAKMPPAISRPQREFSDWFCDVLHRIAGIRKVQNWLSPVVEDNSHNTSSASLPRRTPSADSMASRQTAATSVRSEHVAVVRHPVLEDFLFQPQVTSGHYSPPPSESGYSDAESYNSEAEEIDHNNMTQEDLDLETNLEVARCYRYIQEAVAISTGSVDFALAIMNEPNIVADIRIMADRHRIPIASFRGSERRHVFRSSRAGFTADRYVNSTTAMSRIF